MNNIVVNVTKEDFKKEIHQKLDIEQVKAFGQRTLKFVMTQKDIIKKTCLGPYDHDYLTLNLDVWLCDNQTIQEINREHRCKDQPTDVITFALFADAKDFQMTVGEQLYLGEVIISLEKVEEQAPENKKTFEEEFYFVFAHGILHLLGFNHKDEKSLTYMLELQEKMVKVRNNDKI